MRRAASRAAVLAAALALAAGACAPRPGDHLALVSAKGRSFRVPAPVGMISDLGRSRADDTAHRAAVPANSEMLAHFSSTDTALRARHASFEMARSLPPDDDVSRRLFAEMHRFAPERFQRVRFEAPPATRDLVRRLLDNAATVTAAEIDLAPGEQVPVVLTRNDQRAISYFTLVGIPVPSEDGLRDHRTVIVGTTIALLEARVVYLYVVDRVPESGDPAAAIRPVLRVWTEKVLAANP